MNKGGGKQGGKVLAIKDINATIRNKLQNRCTAYNNGKCSGTDGGVCPHDPTKLHTCSKCAGAHAAKTCWGHAKKDEEQPWKKAKKSAWGPAKGSGKKY